MMFKIQTHLWKLFMYFRMDFQLIPNILFFDMRSE